jgi:hypothetical protein
LSFVHGCLFNIFAANLQKEERREPEGKRPLGRPRRRWVDNIKTDLGEIGWDDVDWIGLAQDRYKWRVLVNLVLNLWVP